MFRPAISFLEHTRTFSRSVHQLSPSQAGTGFSDVASQNGSSPSLAGSIFSEFRFRRTDDPETSPPFLFVRCPQKDRGQDLSYCYTTLSNATNLLWVRTRMIKIFWRNRRDIPNRAADVFFMTSLISNLFFASFFRTGSHFRRTRMRSYMMLPR